jgi:hypothetical protein
VVIGREAGADLVLDDPGISRRHLAARLENGAIVVEDLGSANGTYVNGHRITGAVELAPGDEIQLGNTIIEVQVAAPAHNARGAMGRPSAGLLHQPLGPSPHEEGNIHALAAVFLGPLSIFLLVFSSGAAFFVSLPCGIAAIVLGTIGIRRADTAGEGHRTLARIGRITGIIGTALSILALIAFVLVIALLDASEESLDGLIDRVREEIEGVDPSDRSDRARPVFNRYG